MANAIVLKFEFHVIARTRDECIEMMDHAQNGILDRLGGAPWVMVDDDLQRVQHNQMSIADDQGFVYTGKRACQFTGPVLDTGLQTYHDGFKPQMQAERS